MKYYFFLSLVMSIAIGLFVHDNIGMYIFLATAYIIGAMIDMKDEIVKK